MHVELRNIKHAAFASDETECFQASVWIDGKRAGEVSNEGHGGPNSYWPLDLETRLNTYAATLPPITYGHLTVPMNADLFTSELLCDVLDARQYDRLTKAYVLFVREGKLYQSNKLDKARLTRLCTRPAAAAALRAHWKADVVLNSLPRNEALVLFRKYAGG